MALNYYPNKRTQSVIAVEDKECDTYYHIVSVCSRVVYVVAVVCFVVFLSQRSMQAVLLYHVNYENQVIFTLIDGDGNNDTN